MSALSKLFLSLFKADWDISDYPVRLKDFRLLPATEKGLTADFPARLKPLLRWSAVVVGWPQMSAFGHDSEEALANLTCKFNTYKLSNAPLPRPGLKVPQVSRDAASSDAIEVIAVDFFRNILETNFYTCVLSEEASLGDFLPGGDYDRRISTRYGIDISDIPGGNLVKIISRIHDRYQAAGGPG